VSDAGEINPKASIVYEFTFITGLFYLKNILKAIKLLRSVMVKNRGVVFACYKKSRQPI